MALKAEFAFLFEAHNSPRYAKNGQKIEEANAFQNVPRSESGSKPELPPDVTKEKCKVLLKQMASGVEALKSDSNLWINDSWKNQATQYVLDNLQKMIKCIKHFNGSEMILY
ncbi:unnamed protein product [Soboliphyme baturini]|uniref:MADF domain-containing protein n=1 Tax=Soboliphyme baturini TaxID=241478 RepID=A0A183J7M6_9BILA|nr:unnamed protein product [Soboliphyme baturini]